MRVGGGLGNQLFAYAMYRYWEAKGLNVYMDVDDIFNNRPYFSFMADKYAFRLREYFPNIEIKEIRRGEYFHLPFNILSQTVKNLIKGRHFILLFKKITRKIKNVVFHIPYGNSVSPFGGNERIFYEEPWNRHEYISQFSKYSNIIIERGYFLMYQPAVSLRDILLKELDFVHQMPKYFDKILNEIENTNSVSIHVRRCDYMTREYYYDRGYVCTVQYYKNAVEFMESGHSELKYYIFADDFNWVLANFDFLENYILVDTSIIDKSAYYALFLMSRCKHNILANSCFSWWGAFLNNSPEKTVVCPTDFRGLYIMADEIYPPEWIRVMTVIPAYIPERYVYEETEKEHE
jgi:hypothetical protein